MQSTGKMSMSKPEHSNISGIKKSKNKEASIVSHLIQYAHFKRKYFIFKYH